MILGLTGGYCAGKNAVAALLEGEGWTCIDVDRLGHEAVELGREAIVARFGPGALGADGRIDRRALGRIVFSDRNALRDQEAIVHPIARRLLDERLDAILAEAASAGRVASICVNAALLYRAPQVARCDAVIEVKAPLLARIHRGRERDGLSAWEVLRRIWRQRPFWKLRGAVRKPVHFLSNTGSIARLRARTLELLVRLR